MIAELITIGIAAFITGFLIARKIYREKAYFEGYNDAIEDWGK